MTRAAARPRLATLLCAGTLALLAEVPCRAAPVAPDYLVMGPRAIPITRRDPRGGATRLRLAAGERTVEIGYAVPVDARGNGDDQRPIQLVVIAADGTASAFAQLPQKDAAGDRYVFVLDKGRAVATFTVRGTTRHAHAGCPGADRAHDAYVEYLMTH